MPWGKWMPVRIIDVLVLLVVAVVTLAGCASPSGTSIPIALVDVEFTHFASPSGNIACVITSSGDGAPGGVRCDIDERAWSPPPRPADCRLDYGQGIVLGVGEPAEFVCAGDTTAGRNSEPLAYGDAITAGPIRCESAQSGITCRDAEAGHGFAISREAYQLF